jgi:hypothetical protein
MILGRPGAAPPGACGVTGASVPDPPTSSISRRALCGGLALTLLWPRSGRADVESPDAPKVIEFSPQNQGLLYDEVASKVAPKTGYKSRIALRDSIIRLVRHGVIDFDKFVGLERDGVRMAGDLSLVLSDPSDEPIRLTRENVAVYVNLLWPIGLANRLIGNFSSPLSGQSVGEFASTAGWTLGARDDGAEYFDRFPIVDMTPSEEALAIRVAKTTFRPCCDNSSFFQDCNHGSALYGLMQLGASQGLQELELYREALAFNSFAFEPYYVRTALFFAVERSVVWRDVDPKEIMGMEYSSGSRWRENVGAWVEGNSDLIPQSEDNAKCGV